MSHFTNLKTSFKNLLHLENALNKLEIQYKRKKKVIEGNNSKLYNVNLVIPNQIIMTLHLIGMVTSMNQFLMLVFGFNHTLLKALLINFLNITQMMLLFQKAKKLDFNLLNQNNMQMDLIQSLYNVGIQLIKYLAFNIKILIKNYFKICDKNIY